MITCRLTLKEVNRTHPIAVVGPGDFSFEPSVEITPEQVFADPRFSLYCLDLENQAVIFVECDDPNAVDAAPFYYQAQVSHAVGGVAMSLEDFHRVAYKGEFPTKDIVFVHSVGRCGSTLVSKAFQAIPSVHSLSEPDDLTQAARIRVARAVSDDWLREYVVSSVRWRCKPRVGESPAKVAIKTRSEVMVLGDLIGSSFSESKHLFLYRDGISWIRSSIKGWSADIDFGDRERNRNMEESWSRSLPIIAEYRQDDRPLNPIQIRILAWITCMEGYLRLAQSGIPLAAVRFEDLTAEPIPMLERIFEFCDFLGVDWNAMRAVLDRDSQAGTVYDREERQKGGRKLTDADIRDAHGMISTRPKLCGADTILPGTLSP